MKAFQDRNQAPIGAIGLVVLVLGVIVGLNANNLPIIGGGTSYSAHFRESAGLKADNEVRVAGVKVGKVEDVELDGPQVRVDFTAKKAWIGDHSTVSIEIKTLLGQKYLAIEPRGDHAQDPGDTIPVARTRSPFDITDATKQLSRTVDSIDTKSLAQSFDVLSSSFADSPQHVRKALSGLSQLSKTVSSRDGELATLLGNTSQISATLAGRDQQIRKLLEDGNLLLGELSRRKQAISGLLSGTQRLAAQLRGLVTDNQASLRPALQRLDNVAGVLQRNQDSLGRGLQSLAPFVRVFTNVVGNGRWFDAYICGLIPPTTGVADVHANPDGCLAPPESAGNAGQQGGPS